MRGYIKDLLTSFARSVKEIICLKFSFLCEKNEDKYFAVQTEQTRLIRHLLYGFWFVFAVYSAEHT